MGKMSRREAIGSVAASLVAGSALTSGPMHGFRTTGATSMTLEDFQALNGPGSVAQLFSHMKCTSLSKCHETMREEHGIWIPELVPVFQQLDAMSECSETR